MLFCLYVFLPSVCPLGLSLSVPASLSLLVSLICLDASLSSVSRLVFVSLSLSDDPTGVFHACFLASFSSDREGILSAGEFSPWTTSLFYSLRWTCFTGRV